MARRGGGGGGGLVDRFVGPEVKAKIAETRDKVNALIALERQELAALKKIEQALRGGR